MTDWHAKAEGLAYVMARVEPEPNTGCWLWTGGMRQNGYGCIKQGKRDVAAHRVAFELLVGPIPGGLDLDHLCRVRCCINPRHLEPVTHRENTLRGVSTVARQAARTTCLNGHGFDVMCLRKRPYGTGIQRSCRRCTNEKRNAKRARAREASREQ